MVALAWPPSRGRPQAALWSTVVDWAALTPHPPLTLTTQVYVAALYWSTMTVTSIGYGESDAAVNLHEPSMNLP